MKLFQKIRSFFLRIVYSYKVNKYARVKHIAALIRRIEKNAEKTRARNAALSVRISNLKTALKKLKEKKETNLNPEIERLDRHINELRTVFCEMANAQDSNTKKLIERNDLLENVIAENRKSIVKLSKRIKAALKYEKNTEELVELQKRVKKDFESLHNEFETKRSSICEIDRKFQEAMGIQCQDILRRVKQQLEPQAVKSNSLNYSQLNQNMNSPQ